MPTITLIRHGQASFGAENYDQLSKLGYQQARHLGGFFAQTGRQIDHSVIGAMQRHKQSYESFCEGYASNANTPSAETSNANASNASAPNIDASNADTPSAEALSADALNTDVAAAQIITDYNEFDHEQVLLVGNGLANKTEMAQLLAKEANPKAKLYDLFNQAVARWQSGKHDTDYSESWAAFKTRCWQAFLSTVEILENKPQNTHCVVFTSGGVISAIAGELLGLTDRKIFELNFTMANAAMTQVKTKNGRHQLLSLNEYSYLHDVEKKLITWH